MDKLKVTQQILAFAIFALLVSILAINAEGQTNVPSKETELYDQIKAFSLTGGVVRVGPTTLDSLGAYIN